jgi:acetyltransferase-like isoleucine patch superfamily enzyme
LQESGFETRHSQPAMKELLNRILHKIAYFGPGGYTLRPQIHRMRGARIGGEVWISQYVYLDELYPEAISIGDNSTVGLRTSIITHLHWGPRRTENGFKEVVIERNVFVGPHCLILPGVRVGEGSVIKGGTVLTRNVPPHMFWGVPPSGPLGHVAVPLTAEHSYDDFVRGLKITPRKSQD